MTKLAITQGDTAKEPHLITKSGLYHRKETKHFTAQSHFQRHSLDFYYYSNAVFYPSQSICKKNGALCSETFIDQKRERFYCDRSINLSRWPVVPFPFLCTSIEYCYSGFYHVIADWFPRLWALSQVQHRKSVCLLSRRYSDSLNSLFRFLLPSNVKVIIVPRRARFRARQYLHLPFPSKSLSPQLEHTYTSMGFLPEECHNWLRRELSEYSSSNRTQRDTEFPKRIFVSREKAIKRKLINQSDVEELLRSQGFEKIILEDWTLADQIRFFQNAETIVAQHGAALTNLINCRRNAALLEIHNGRERSHYFSYAAKTFGIRYASIHCTEGDDINVDAEVDISTLKENLGNL